MREEFCKNSEGERFMLRYDPKKKELSSRDVVARAIYREVQEGRGSPHGGAYLDISHQPADFIKSKLPSMYEQFLRWPTWILQRSPWKLRLPCTTPWEGSASMRRPGLPPCRAYLPQAKRLPGLHGANRLGGNSLTDLLVFGRRTGEAAAAYAEAVATPLGHRRVPDRRKRRHCSSVRSRAAAGRNPYLLHQELQDGDDDSRRHRA